VEIPERIKELEEKEELTKEEELELLEYYVDIEMETNIPKSGLH